MEDENIDVLARSIHLLHPHIEKDALDFLLTQCILRKYGNRDQIIKAGVVQRGIFFITSGLVRGFYVDSEGNEISTRFIHNQGWVTHYTALLSGTPSKYTFQCLEECDVIELPWEIIQSGYRQFPSSLEKLGRLIAEEVLKSQQSRIESFQFLDAEQRYLEFIAHYPDLFNRVSLSHLSTYLGIQRQSLTRIRKKIASRKSF